MTDFAPITAALADGGMRRAFTVPSIHSLALLEAVEAAGIECLPARTELGAAHMADGHARIAGEPTGLITSTGPGAGNAVGGFATAAKDGSPVVHLTTTNYPGGGASAGVHGLHTVPEQSQWTSYGAPVLDFGSGDPQAELMELSRGRQPFTVMVPVTDDRAGTGFPVNKPHQVVEQSDAVLDAALRTWLDGERRLLWIGGGARSVGSARLVDLAERTGAAVVTSTQAKDLFPAEHPALLGCTWNPPEVRDVGGVADVCLVLGSRLTEISTAVWSTPFPATVIDVGLGERGHLFPDTSAHQIEATCERAIDRLDRLVEGPPRSWGRTAQAQVAAGRARREPGDALARTLLDGLAEGVAEDDILVADMTKTSFHALVGARLPRRARFLFPGLLNMGFGLPAALGASIAAPDRHVVGIVGDGSLLSVLPELEVARDHPGTTTLLLLDDQAYGLLDHRMSESLAERTARFPGPDWTAVGQAFGLPVDDVAAGDVGRCLSQRSSGVALIRVDVKGLGNDWRLS